LVWKQGAAGKQTGQGGNSEGKGSDDSYVHITIPEMNDILIHLREIFDNLLRYLKDLERHEKRWFSESRTSKYKDVGKSEKKDEEKGMRKEPEDLSTEVNLKPLPLLIYDLKAVFGISPSELGVDVEMMLNCVDDDYLSETSFSLFDMSLIKKLEESVDDEYIDVYSMLNTCPLNRRFQKSDLVSPIELSKKLDSELPKKRNLRNRRENRNRAVPSVSQISSQPSLTSSQLNPASSQSVSSQADAIKPKKQKFQLRNILNLPAQTKKNTASGFERQFTSPSLAELLNAYTHSLSRSLYIRSYVRAAVIEHDLLTITTRATQKGSMLVDDFHPLYGHVANLSRVRANDADGTHVVRQRKMFANLLLCCFYC
jgi:hypothetical protein